MSLPILILGESGTGKSASMRNLDPARTLLIQSVRKPLPFRNQWKPLGNDSQNGNVIVSRDYDKIKKWVLNTRRDIVVVDDFQYLMFGEMMDRAGDTGFQKFTDMASHVWSLMSDITNDAGNKRVYFLSHTETTDAGQTRMKTVGKLLQEKLTVEGLFTIVLRSDVFNGSYRFSTHNSGADTVKSPLGMFAEDFIDNDLAAIDAEIVSYYGIEPATKAD